jgi:hypothetical protein
MLSHLSIRSSGLLFKKDFTRSTIHFAIIFSLALLLAPVTSFSETTIHRLTGQTATAIFFYTEPSGCIYYELNLSSYTGTEITAPGNETSATQVFLTLLEANNCTNVYASGTATSGDLQLKMNPGLTSATLQGTVPICLYSWPDPNPSCTDLIVNLEWSGRGEIFRQSSNNRFVNQYPYSMITERNSGNSREALVTGSVLNGTTNLTPSDATQFGYLGFSQQRTLTIYKQ